MVHIIYVLYIWSILYGRIQNDESQKSVTDPQGLVSAKNSPKNFYL